MTTFDERGRHHPHVEVISGVDLWTEFSDTPSAISADLVVQGNAGGTALEFGLNLDNIATDVTANNAKVSNATHTGEVAGATGLIVDPTAISNKTLKSVLAGAEEVLVNDAGNLKKTTVQDIADLGGTAAGVFGTEFEIFQSLSQTNTAAASTNKVNATTASKPIGKYRIGFYCDITNSDGTDIWEVQFLVDGASIHQHDNGSDLYQNKPNGNNDWSSESSVHYLTLSVAATISLQIKFGTNDNTARAANATIEIWRVS